MTSDERDAFINLRIVVQGYAKSCVLCRGSGKLRSGRCCPGCRRAREAMDRSDPLLMPTTSDTDQVRP
jgi:hypothetical protein